MDYPTLLPEGTQITKEGEKSVHSLYELCCQLTDGRAAGIVKLLLEKENRSEKKPCGNTMPGESLEDMPMMQHCSQQ
jgi:hypothetical protein